MSTRLSQLTFSWNLPFFIDQRHADRETMTVLKSMCLCDQHVQDVQRAEEPGQVLEVHPGCSRSLGTSSTSAHRWNLDDKVRDQSLVLSLPGNFQCFERLLLKVWAL